MLVMLERLVFMTCIQEFAIFDVRASHFIFGVKGIKKLNHRTQDQENHQVPGQRTRVLTVTTTNSKQQRPTHPRTDNDNGATYAWVCGFLKAAPWLTARFCCCKPYPDGSLRRRQSELSEQGGAGFDEQKNEKRSISEAVMEVVFKHHMRRLALDGAESHQTSVMHFHRPIKNSPQRAEITLSLFFNSNAAWFFIQIETGQNVRYERVVS